MPLRSFWVSERLSGAGCGEGAVTLSDMDTALRPEGGIFMGKAGANRYCLLGFLVIDCTLEIGRKEEQLWNLTISMMKTET